MRVAPRYDVGQQYLPLGKHTQICTVTDIYTTYNAQGEQVSIRYVATSVFLGQSIRHADVAEATIARGIDNLETKKGLK